VNVDRFFVSANGDGAKPDKSKRGSLFFFVNKKEAKKTSFIWAQVGFPARAPAPKSFLLLFFKKEAVPYLH
jgi:hypothetical protein